MDEFEFVVVGGKWGCEMGRVFTYVRRSITINIKTYNIPSTFHERSLGVGILVDNKITECVLPVDYWSSKAKELC